MFPWKSECYSSQTIMDYKYKFSLLSVNVQYHGKTCLQTKHVKSMFISTVFFHTAVILNVKLNFLNVKSEC